MYFSQEKKCTTASSKDLQPAVQVVSKTRHAPWSVKEDKALVQFVSLFKSEQPTESTWPAMKVPHSYWSKAAAFIAETASSVKRAGKAGKPLMPLDRMPFGLIEYQLEFFTATNIMQVCRALYSIIQLVACFNTAFMYAVLYI